MNLTNTKTSLLLNIIQIDICMRIHKFSNFVMASWVLHSLNWYSLVFGTRNAILHLFCMIRSSWEENMLVLSNIQIWIRSMYKVEYKVFTRSKQHFSSWLSQVNHGLNIQQFVFMLSETLCPTSYFRGDKLLQAYESLFKI